MDGWPVAWRDEELAAVMRLVAEQAAAVVLAGSRQRHDDPYDAATAAVLAGFKQQSAVGSAGRADESEDAP